MIAADAWTALTTTLQNDPTLSGYMKYVYEGRRYDIEPESLPCIMLEPTQVGDIEREFNQTQDVYLKVDLFAFSTANYNEYPKTIVGDQSYKGILDIENDIRACLQRSYTLGDAVIDTRVDAVQFDQIDMDKYPVRGLLMPIRILYRQINEA